MRVAVVVPTYSEKDLDLFGGGERYAYRIAQALAPSIDVTLVTFGPRHRERAIGVRHVTVRANGAHPENPFPRLGFFLAERFDVIHVFQFRSTVTSLLAAVGTIKRTPLVVTDVGGGGRSLMYRLHLYRLVSRFILISDFSRRILPPSIWPRAVVVKGGIDLARFQYDRRPRKRQVVQVGRILPHKGIDSLIEACGADIPVVVAGRVMDQRYYEYLRDQSRGKPVTFLIDPDDDTVLELYRTSSVTVAASVYRDVFGKEWPNSELLGLTMLESMAVGTPVVCTLVGGMPEYVVDGVTGFTVTPGNAAELRAGIERLLGDATHAAGMGRAGHEHVQQYSWERVAGRFVEEYRRL